MALDLLRVLEQAGVQRLYDGRTEISGLCPNPQHNDASAVVVDQQDHVPAPLLLVRLLRHPPRTPDRTDGLGTPRPGVDAEERRASSNGWPRPTETPSPTLEDTVPLLTEFSLANLLASVPDKCCACASWPATPSTSSRSRYDRETREWVLPIRSPAGVL